METPRYQKAKDKMAIRRPHISIMTLNANGLNSPIKRHRVAEWFKKQNSTICCLQETHLSSKDKYRLKVKEYGISSKWHSEKSGSSGTNIRLNRLQNKKGKGRYGGTLHNDKGNHAPRRHNTY